MTDRPTGTVTFLFTDIEGSTQLWEQHPEAMKAALARHDALLRGCCEARNGYVFKTVGDAFCVAFASPIEALLAALEAQRALSITSEVVTAVWPLRVRMGLHTGEAEEREGDYFGPSLNRVARLMSAGHGGQILLSVATQELIRDRLPPPTALHDLGERRLKDLIRPEHIFQLLAPDLPVDFPPLKTLDTFRTNLPIQLTSFVGREKEIAEVHTLLAGPARLITLTGPGGTGKTRLSLQVAADFLDAFPEGVWFIELAPLADPALVPQTIAATLELREEPNRSILTILTNYLRAKKVLLILDNCEHLVEAAAQLVETLLRTCPQLHILASSREALGVAGETPFRVPSLSLPDPRHLPPIATLSHYEAVRLFIERAVTVLPSFSVTNQNALALAQVCHRLDGIPLAIELAATRVATLRVEQIATRLDNAFRLLTGGSRTALPRQQTLRALIDWSHDLLSDTERTLLRRLSVFTGGWTLEAAEAVCADTAIETVDILDVMTQLVNKSLVFSERRQGQETRYRLLETIRQYALERLATSGEADSVRQRHATYYLALAEVDAPGLTNRSQPARLSQMEREHDNFRAALAWSQVVPGGAELGLRLCDALSWFWVYHGYWKERLSWEEGALAHPEAANYPQRYASVLINTGTNLSYLGDYHSGRAKVEHSLNLLRELGDRPGAAWALHWLGNMAREHDDAATARAYLEESVAVFREVGNKLYVCTVTNTLAEALTMQDEIVLAKAMLDDNLALGRQLGDIDSIGWTLNHLGHVAQLQGDYEQAIRLHEESLALFHAIGVRNIGTLWARQSLGETMLAQDDGKGATVHFVDGLVLSRDLSDQSGIAWCLAGLACVAAINEDLEHAAWLWGVAETLRQSIGVREAPASRATHERLKADVRARLGEAIFEAKWAEGQAAAPEQAISEALQHVPEH